MSDALLQRLANRVRLTVGRCVLAAVNDDLKLQGVQVELLSGEVRDGCERMQDYGFTSHPHPGAEGVALAVGGSRDHVLVLAVGDRRYRLKGLEQGEVAMYSDEGDSVVLKRGRVIEVTAGTKVVLTTPLVEVAQDMTVGGNVTVGGDVVASGISLVHHTHLEHGVDVQTDPPTT